MRNARIKVFVFARTDRLNPEKIEKEINSWIEENDEQIEVVFRTHGSDAYNHMIGIWYKEIKPAK